MLLSILNKAHQPKEMIDRLIRFIVTVSFVAFLFFSFFKPLEFEDGWWHLATGKWIVDHHQVPIIDPFSFTPEASSWVFTKWLGSTIFYLSYLVGGYAGVKSFRCFLLFLIIGIFFYYSKRRLPYSHLLILICVLTPAIWARSFFRPDIFNYIFMQIFLSQIISFQMDKNPKRLLMLPLFSAIWGNIHPGSFMYGLSLVLAGLANSIWEYIQTFRNNEKELRLKVDKEINLFLVLFVSCLLALCISPYGFEALMYPFKLFAQQDFINFYKNSGFISEQLPPSEILSLGGAWFWVLFVCGVLALVYTKSRKFLSMTLFCVPLLMFLQSRRASAFFALSAAYVIVECCRQNSVPARWKAYPWSMILDRILLVGLAIFFTVQIGVSLNKNIYNHGSYQKNWTLTYSPYNPVKAVDFLLDHRMAGNVFTNYRFGGYLIWKGYPKLKPFIDGRQLDQALFMQFAKLTLSGPEQYWDEIEKNNQIDIVLFDMAFPRHYKLANYLISSGRWQIVFIDGRCVVLIRKASFPDLNIQTPQVIGRRGAMITQDQMNLLKILSHGSFAQMVLKISRWPQPLYIQELNEGVILFNLGFRKEGVQRIIKSYPLDPITVKGVISRILLELYPEQFLPRGNY